MEIVKQDYEIWGKCPLSYTEGLHWIEKAGRTCYKSDDKITASSATSFIKDITVSGHKSIIEHSNIVLRYKIKHGTQLWGAIYTKLRGYFRSRWIHVETDEKGYIYVFGNWRAFFEFTQSKTTVNVTLEAVINHPLTYHNIDGVERVTSYSSIPGFAHRYTVKFLTDRAVLAQLIRHRDDVGFSVESQSHCNYCVQDGGELKYIKQWFYDGLSPEAKADVLGSLEYAEIQYKKAILHHNMSADQARYVLPNATAVEVVMSAYLPEWMHLFTIRRSKASYKQTKLLIEQLYQEFITVSQFKGV